MGHLYILTIVIIQPAQLAYGGLVLPSEGFLRDLFFSQHTVIDW